MAGAAVAMAALAAAPGAAAGPGQEAIVQDDHLLLRSGPQARDRGLDEIAALGATTIRVLVEWNAYAPAASSTVRPRFNAADPRAYDPAFTALDGLVAGAGARRLNVMLVPTTPAPVWASRCGGLVRLRPVCDPSPAEFGRFVTALGRRYPRAVRRWGIMNEPNVDGRLAPQYIRAGRRWVPRSPALYRALVRAATGALRATGHGRDLVLLGETAPVGGLSSPAANRSMQTDLFLRTLLCVGGGARLPSAIATSSLGCRPFARLAVTGFAHHPYQTRGGASPMRPPRDGGFSLGNLGPLYGLLARGVQRGRIPAGLPMHLTEYGFQTSPPDALLGIPLAIQARHLDASAYVAYRDRRVASLAQYLLFDDDAPAGFQSGLRFRDGRPKPALDAFRLPIWVEPRGSDVEVFGQVRPARELPDLVEIQRRQRAGATWETVRFMTVTGRRALFLARVARRGGEWRLRWTPPRSSTPFFSRTAGERR